MLTNRIFRAIKKWCSDVLGTGKHLRYLEKEDRRRRLAGQFLTIVSIAMGIIYLVWHWQHINWDAWYYSFPFFLAELTGLVLFSFFAFNAWFLRFHAPEGVGFEGVFSVDVFIPVAGEPVELVRKTIEAALQIDYQNKRVHLLDDKEDEQYKILAEAKGCVYFARKDHSDAKAGNLNYALQQTEGNLILVLDADQVPHPQIVNHLIGYFKIPKIAFVQTKQDFEVPVSDPFGNSDRIFYNVMQSGKDNDNAAFSCGSGVMYRRAALQEIGGFSTWNIVEDVHTSMLLHERGWRSVYYNYPLTKGTAPIDLYGVYNQRKQWAADSLRILFWDNPFLHKGLTFKQKLQYFHLGFVYLVAAFIMPFFFITPFLALLTQEFVLTAPVPSYVLHRFFYFIAMSLAYGVLNYPTPYMKPFQMWTGLFPVFIQATWIAIRSRKKKPEYRVNAKPLGLPKYRSPWTTVFPQLGIILLALFSIGYGFVSRNIGWDFYLLNSVWAIWSIWTMSGICLAAVRKHKWPDENTIKDIRSPSFLYQTKELSLTVILSLSVLVFFTFWDTAGRDQFFSRLHLKVLRTRSLEKPGIPIIKPIPEPAGTSLPALKKDVIDIKKSVPKTPLPDKKVERQYERLATNVISVGDQII